MGKYHSNKKANRKNRLIWHWTNFVRNLCFLKMASREILSAPLWSLWHWCGEKMVLKYSTVSYTHLTLPTICSV